MPGSDSAAPEPEPPVVAVPRATSRPQIDGLFHDAEWKCAAHLANFSSVDDHYPAPVQTTAHVTHDEKGIYFAVLSPVLPGIDLKADRVKRDDDVWQDDAIQSFLFWGSPGGYSDSNRSSLLVDSGHASQSADFDGDGLIDLAISCHSKDGDHFVNSRVYYNDGDRFASPRCQLLPTVGPHYMYRADVGYQYDRRYRQNYESSVFHWKGPRATARLSAEAEVKGTCQLAFEVRSAVVATELDGQMWQVASDGRYVLQPEDRCIQYRATFTSDNGERYPVLDRVLVDLE